MAGVSEQVADALHERWLVFRHHHPVGAYLPVGQLDGDCRCGRGSWPCPVYMAALEPVLADAWNRGMRTGSSRAMRKMSDEPGLALASEADNPYGDDWPDDEDAVVSGPGGAPSGEGLG